MCGRYKLSVPFREIVRLYNLTQANSARFDNMPARYNIAPTQDVPVVRLNRDTRGRELVMVRRKRHRKNSRRCSSPCPSEAMEAVKVSTKVNSPRNERVELLQFGT